MPSLFVLRSSALSAALSAVALAASVAGRQEIAGVYTYLERQLDQLDVDVRLDSPATLQDVLDLEPDHVVVATGSAPSGRLVGNIAKGILHTPGLEREEVLNVWQVLEDEAPVGHRVLVVDDGEGSWKAISLALQLDAQGHAVHLSSPLPYVGAKIGPFSQNRLLPRLHASGITLHPFASLTAVTDEGAQLSKAGATVLLDAIDTVILAGWHEPVQQLYHDVKAAAVQVQRVGDAIASRTMMEAVHEGERAARRV